MSDISDYTCCDEHEVAYEMYKLEIKELEERIEAALILLDCARVPDAVRALRGEEI